MTVGELKEVLKQYDDNLEVFTKKTELLGNIGYIFSVKKDTYGFFGADLHVTIYSLINEVELRGCKVIWEGKKAVKIVEKGDKEYER